MSNLDDIRTLATRFFDAIERGDVETVAGCYAPEVRIWHNTDGAEQSRDDNLETLRGLVRFTSRRAYARRRLEVFPGGFVQQHVLQAVRRDGAEVNLPACLVCAVQDGRITRLDEYLDAAQVTAFVGRPAV